MSPERRLAELGIRLPPPFPPVGSYVNAVRVGDQGREAARLAVGVSSLPADMALEIELSVQVRRGAEDVSA